MSAWGEMWWWGAWRASDGRPDFLASGSEWRTAPLWGIGLTAVVNGHTNFLHDGRARNLMEAILWHDGEAASAKTKILALSQADREALLAFLGSLWREPGLRPRAWCGPAR